MKTPRLPTVHLNGSSVNNLKDDWLWVSDAARTLLNKLTEASPNSRDYYPQGGSAYAIARDEHADRMRAVQGIVADANLILAHLQSQQDLRKR